MWLFILPSSYCPPPPSNFYLMSARFSLSLDRQETHPGDADWTISENSSPSLSAGSGDMLTLALRQAIQRAYQKAEFSEGQKELLEQRKNGILEGEDAKRSQILLSWILEEVILEFRSIFLNLPLYEDVHFDLDNFYDPDVPLAKPTGNTQAEPVAFQGATCPEKDPLKDAEKIKSLLEILKNRGHFCPGVVKIGDDQTLQGMFTAYAGRLFFYYLDKDPKNTGESGTKGKTEPVKFIKDIFPAEIVSYRAPDKSELEAMTQARNPQALWVLLG